MVGRTITLDNRAGTGHRRSGAAGIPTFPTPTPMPLHRSSSHRTRRRRTAGRYGRRRRRASRPGQRSREHRATSRRPQSCSRRTSPNSNTKLSAHITPLRNAVVGGVQSMLQLLAVAVGVVLLIACANIANLILGRAHGRAREFAVRSALGGSPGRVRRQVFTESLMLAVIGGVAGVAIAPVLTRGLVAVYPMRFPRRGNRDRRARDGRRRARDDRGRRVAALPTARRAARLDLSVDLRNDGRSGGRPSREGPNASSSRKWLRRSPYCSAPGCCCRPSGN